MYGKDVSIVGDYFRSRWVKRSANADRKSLGKFGPAFISDIGVVPDVQAGQACVHLQGTDQKGMVRGS